MTDQLTKLYVEITTTCNLDCRMCVRREWNEDIGAMPLETFETLVEQLSALPGPVKIHLGGYGEPTHHPQFLDIVAAAKQAGITVEMVTNGTLLDEEMSLALLDLGLDRLLVSIDGASAEQYEDIRVRAEFEQVIDNLQRLRQLKLRRANKHSNPQVGIAFVAMKSNVADMGKLPWLATRIGAWEILVSNVVPHSAEMEKEILYERSLTACAYRESMHVANMSLPKMDINGKTGGPLHDVFNSTASISLLDASLSGRNDYCRFVQEGYAVVRWDGEVSPCLPLLHDHPQYIRGRRKNVTHVTMGNIQERTLGDIWGAAEYVDFRTRLRDFPFSPCSTCGGCERFAGNIIDCVDNTFPVCGGCLWAQGFVQCP